MVLGRLRRFANVMSTPTNAVVPRRPSTNQRDIPTRKRTWGSSGDGLSGGPPWSFGAAVPSALPAPSRPRWIARTWGRWMAGWLDGWMAGGGRRGAGRGELLCRLRCDGSCGHVRVRRMRPWSWSWPWSSYWHSSRFGCGCGCARLHSRSWVYVASASAWGPARRVVPASKA